MSIDLKDRDKMDVLLKILELNENHVEWIKDMDYKVTYYTFVFLIALVQRGGKEHPFRRIIGALQLSQVNSYSTEQIVTLRQSDRLFHLGRSLYGALIIASGVLAGLFVVQVPASTNLSSVIDRSRIVAARASETTESEWAVESIQRDWRTGVIRLGFRNSKTTEAVLIDFDVAKGDVQSLGKVGAAKP